jgi:hypothetical protein
MLIFRKEPADGLDPGTGSEDPLELPDLYRSPSPDGPQSFPVRFVKSYALHVIISPAVV